MTSYWIILIEIATPTKSFVSWNDLMGVAHTFQSKIQAESTWFDCGMDTVAAGRAIEITKTSL